MAVVTFELPEAMAKRLLSMPEQERNRFAVAAFTHAEAGDVRGEDRLTPVDLDALLAEDRDSVLRGLADSDNGRVVSADSMFARLRQVTRRGA